MNPLDEVIEWYNFNINQQEFFMEIVKNSHKIDNNIVANAILKKYKLSSQKKDDIKIIIDNSKKELDNLTIVSLWAVFEAFLNDNLKKQTDKITLGIVDPISNEIINYALKGVDRWLKDEVLELFKIIISNSYIVGNVKDIYKYRNWISHGKSGEKPPVSNLTPFMAYQRLTVFLTEAKLIEENIDE